MATPSFYTPDLELNSIELMLPSEEAAHAIKSRRLGQGTTIRLFNGQGLTCEAQITNADRRNVSVAVREIVQHKSPTHRLIIAAAVPKGDRQKVMVDILTQLGVCELQPIACKHSVSHFNDKLKAKWQRWAIEACKQSQNPWLPTIRDQCDIGHLLSASENLCYTDMHGQSLVTFIQDYSGQESQNLTALIGPEGGFSKSEIQLFNSKKITAVSLAGHILRTEAATISLASQWAQSVC